MLTSDLKPFEEMAQSFAAKELFRKTEEHDRYPFGEFFTGVLEKACDVGFLGILLPEKLGGIGGGISTLCIILDHICRVDASLGGIIFTNAFAQEILLGARDENLASGIYSKASGARECLIAYPSFWDPSHMSKLPRAVGSGDEYTLSGDLEYLVLGNLAQQAIIPARTGSDPYSFFLIDLSSKGPEMSGPIFSLGLHACPCVDISLKEVKARLIGEAGKGTDYFTQASEKMHAAAAAMNAGIMRGSYLEAFAYAKERFQGGWEIINWSEVSMLLADMSVKADVADMCVAQSCLALEQGRNNSGAQCISAALHVHELACEAVTDGIQVLGGNGYMKDYGQEKRFRDARQVQALLGAAPMKKISLIRKAAGLEAGQ